MPFGPAFEIDEYRARLDRTRAAMDAAGIEVLIATDPSNQNWLSGYDGWSFYVPQAVVVPLADPPFWWGRGQDANGAVRTVERALVGVEAYPDAFVQSDHRHPMSHLAGLLQARGLGSSRIGVEMEAYSYSARAHAALGAALPDGRFVDATNLVNWLRGIKSPAELAHMRRAARIAETVMGRALELAAPGVRKNELAAELMATAIRGTGDAWGDYPAIVPLMPSGTDAAAPHLTWNGDVMQAGEATFFELAGCYRRYHVPLSRTIFLGTPPEHLLRAEAALLSGLEAGIEVARAGNRACDIAEALGAAIARAGIDRAARCGYAVGLSYPPDWGERTVSLRPEDHTLLQPGMTFHFMPGIWMQDWGLEITETILIRPDGPAEPFCKVPRRLVVRS